jgi:hypothetical protein
MKIVITESQLKILLSEVKGDPKKKKEEGDPKKKKEEGDPKKKKGGSNDYEFDQDLEEIVITYNKETKETTGKVSDWQYVGSKGRRKRGGAYWIAKGIDIGGLKNKILKFSKKYAEYMSNSDNVNSYIGPVVTSGYRGAKRQVDAIWDQWSGDKKYLNLYRKEFGNPIEKIFKDNEDSPKEAKKLATEFLKGKEKEGKYMSSHQQKGAIDISLFKGDKYGDKNEDIKKFLSKSKKDGDIVRFIDERSKPAPHFHIQLT